MLFLKCADWNLLSFLPQSDNDFLTEDGVTAGQPYDAGLNVDNQFLVFQVTLPIVPAGSVQKAIGA